MKKCEPILYSQPLLVGNGSGPFFQPYIPIAPKKPFRLVRLFCWPIFKSARRDLKNLAFDTLPLEEVVKAFKDNKDRSDKEVGTFLCGR